jgi:16S rRNA (cytosine1402-N4)-methyltransferase
MLAEVRDWLPVAAGDAVIDGTVGSGGHAAVFLAQTGPAGILLGVDRDPRALAHARERLKPFGRRVQLVQGGYEELPRIVRRLHFPPARAVLLDLGFASFQLAMGRGFSFADEASLDMRYGSGVRVMRDARLGRFSGREGVTARELLNQLPLPALQYLLRRYGEEKHAATIARALMRARPLRSAAQVAAVVGRVLPRRRLHPATRTFLALRIVVNGEWDNLRLFLASAQELVAPGGRVGIISYHSGEDRIVKHTWREQAREGIWEIVTPKPIIPSAAEVQRNRRARSAKLRVVEKAVSRREFKAK